MHDVQKWLEGLGLAKYATVFADNEIDWDALPHLTDDMLSEMGLPIGPRAKLLGAIASLRAAPPAPAERSAQAPPHASAAASMATTPAREPEERQAERRQITILFSDLADSTQLAARLDPEDLRALMQRYQQACGTAIDHYAGHVAQYMGDGIVAYFGWPTAQEDAAERAVRAGLDIVEAVKDIDGAEPLAVRVGITTGIVVISDTGHGDPSVPQGAVGASPHIAARLQSLAPPNAVVISEATSRIVAALCLQEDLGEQNLKGVAEPMHVYRVKRMHTSRFLATRARSLTPFVGRQAELALLLERWRDARDGEGQVVYVSGVPGIGKSRIVYELEQRIKDKAHLRVRLQCSPHDTQSPLFPIIRAMERVAKLRPEDARQTKLDKLKRLILLSTDDVDRALPLFAQMMSIPVDAPGAGASPQQIKDQTLLLLVDLLLGLARDGPVFCLLEDAQWIDPSTQEFLDMVAGRIGQKRILFAVTHRPEYRPRVGDHSNVSTLAIARLPRRDVAELARLALHEQAVSRGVMQRILEDSEAIPLYIEELVRGLPPADETVPARRAAGEEPRPEASSVPDSLRDSLVARLDRVPQGRRVAQVAAVIGREFSYPMLQALAAVARTELDATLSYLTRAEIFQQVERDPVARFAFTHALLRDVAYESMLKSARRDIHAKVAEALRVAAPEVEIAQPELLAYHYAQAGNAAAAVRYWLAGGQRARSRSAHLEAIGQLQSALEYVKLLPASPERAATELEIHLTLGLSSIAVHGYSAPSTREAFERACELCVQLDDPQHTLQAFFGLWGHYWMTAEHGRAMALAESLLEKARAMNDPTGQVVGHRALGSTLFTRGDFVAAREHLERALALAEQAPAQSTAFAVDPRIAAQLLLAWDLWVLGYADGALQHVTQALDRATRNADPYTCAFAHYVTSAIHLLRGEPTESLAHATRSLALSTEHRINLYALYSRFGCGCAMSLLGENDEALVEIRTGIDEARRSNLGYMSGFMMGWLATAQATGGDPKAGLATVEEALARVDDGSGRAWEAELQRLRADMLVASGASDDEAARCYLEAIAVARRQHARALELRAATSLAARLYASGRSAEARTQLAPVVAWFTEGRATADLARAQALLDTLG
jgi:class 3 adenylate cyclase/tetratricopeptide (TPR) repeat protein